MISHTIKSSLSRDTINRLYAFRSVDKKQKKRNDRSLAKIVKSFVLSKLHMDIHKSREIAYGKDYANSIQEIRMMSKKQLFLFVKSHRYVKGLKLDHIRLNKNDYMKIQLYTYANNRLMANYKSL